MCEKYGGPRQFLAARFPTTEAMVEFHSVLAKPLPLDETMNYWGYQDMPAVKETELAAHPALALHPSLFSWHVKSSIKPDPEAAVCLRLVEWFEVEGFTSSEEPFWLAPLSGVDVSEGAEGNQSGDTF